MWQFKDSYLPRVTNLPDKQMAIRTTLQLLPKVDYNIQEETELKLRTKEAVRIANHSSDR